MIQYFPPLLAMELAATLFGLLFVYLRIKQNNWCWPVGLLYIIPSLYLFHEWKLYSDFWLHIFYIGTTFYGWWFWTRGGRAEETDSVPIRNLNLKTGAITIASIALGTGLAGYYFKSQTDASFPFWDAFTSIGFVVAELLATRKIFENWYLFIVMNITAGILYILKEGYIYSGLYFVFLILAIRGAWVWKKQK